MSEWISVEDRLPEYGEKVLFRYVMDYKFPEKTISSKVKVGMCCGCLSSTNKNGHRYDLDARKHCYVFNVTHWMPIPEPPK